MARKTDAVVIGRILDLAEQLYGQHGFGAVSLSQIRRLAGSGNKNVIAYHFGGEDGLIRAILARRVPEVDAVRISRFAEARAAGRSPDVRSLTALMFEPLLQHVDGRGERVLARFVLALLSSDEGRKWSAEFGNLQPTVFAIMDELIEQTGIPAPLLYERQRLVAIMVLTSIFNRQEPFDGPDMDQALIENVLDMASAAIQVPVSKLSATLRAVAA